MTAHLRHIRRELARELGHPHRDVRTGYDIVAFLDDDGWLDLESCRAEADLCRVRRFVQDATVATGHLRHTTGDPWVLDFPGGPREDATGFRLGDECFVPGNTFPSCRNGATHTYCVECFADLRRVSGRLCSGPARTPAGFAPRARIIKRLQPLVRADPG